MAEEGAGLCDGNGKEKVLLLRLKPLLKGELNGKLLQKSSEILTFFGLLDCNRE